MPSFSTSSALDASALSSSSSSSTSSPYFRLYKDFTSTSLLSSCDVIAGRPRVTTHAMPSFSTSSALNSSALSSSSSSSTSSPNFRWYKDFTSTSLLSSCDVV